MGKNAILKPILIGALVTSGDRFRYVRRSGADKSRNLQFPTRRTKDGCS